MYTGIVLLAALATLTASCASGSDHDAVSDSTTPASASASAEPPAAGTGDSAAPALDDATIVAIFDAANAADIETGQLAAERGHARAVRDFGAMLARDHRAVRRQGRDLAAKLGLAPTPPADDPAAEAHAAAMATLRATRGEEFDAAFLDHEVRFHQGVIDAVKATLLPAIQNEELRAFVVKVAPAFEAHRAAAANLRQKIGA